MKKTYTELIQLPTFEERFEYLRLNGAVSDLTFGSYRQLNQALYRSNEWKSFRRQILIRDNACDLAVEGFEIIGNRAIIHHLNPITKRDILDRNPCLFDPENVITTTHNTHQAIHYGGASILPKAPVERRPGDTCPWR